MGIEKGKKIAFEYTLTVDGQKVDSSEGRGPLEYTHGEGSIIPGLVNRMEGMEVGEERKIQVPPEEGYGSIDPEAVKEVSRNSLPKDADLKIGTILQAKDDKGMVFPIKITGIKDDTVIVDLNHPLAGKELEFDIKVVSIQ